MTDKEARERAASLEPRKVAEIPEDLDLATLEDFDDLEEGFTIVPLEGKSGKIHNWVTRSLTAGERAMASRSMFPKTAIQQAMKDAGNKKKVDLNVSDMDPEQLLSGMYQKDCLTIKTGVVYPKGVTLDYVKKLPVDHFDALLRAIDKEVEADDVVSRFPDGDDRPDNGEEPTLKNPGSRSV